MTVAPISSTIVALALIPVAFLFCHAFLSGRHKNRFHSISGAVAIIWDLSLSIGYMMYRTFGGAVDNSILTLTPTLSEYFAVHIATAVVVMSLELAVLAIGFYQLKVKAPNIWHRKLTRILFYVWWFAFLSGEIFYIVMYVF